MKMRIHAIEPISRANGPGRRFVIWTQGCSRCCPGCFNPQTHDPQAGLNISVQELVRTIKHNRKQIEGVTISGGEPLEQAPALLDLLKQIKNLQLSVVLFSGYTLPEIQAQPYGQDILRLVDVLIAGPYFQAKPATAPLLGSSNQKIHFLSDRYSEPDLANIPASEIFLQPDGSLRVNGIKSAVLPEKR